MSDETQRNTYAFYTQVRLVQVVEAASVEEATTLLKEHLDSGELSLAAPLTMGSFALGLGEYPPVECFASLKPIGMLREPYTYILASSLKKAVACADKSSLPADEWAYITDPRDLDLEKRLPPLVRVWIYGDAVTLDKCQGVLDTAARYSMPVEYKS